MRKVFWFILAFVLTISSCFWGSIIWFSCIQFIFTENISIGMIFAVWMGILVSIINALCMATIKNIYDRHGSRITISSHSFEIFEYLMLIFFCEWVGIIYDVFMFGILKIRKSFLKASETCGHLTDW